jgi:hypothetical protein
MHNEGQIYLMDFGTAKYLDDGIVHDDFGCHNPWGYAPESYHDKEYSFDADVHLIGSLFSELASYDGQNNYEPYGILYKKEYGKDKD